MQSKPKEDLRCSTSYANQKKKKMFHKINNAISLLDQAQVYKLMLIEAGLKAVHLEEL